MSQDFIFRIAGSYSPDDIPLDRLGEYLKAFAELLGERANVHFSGIEAGSTILKARADFAAAPKVSRRVLAAATGAGDEQIARAVRKIDDMLADDNATGSIVASDGNVIRVDFAGRERPKPLVYGPIKQNGVIDGTVVRIEGGDSTVHVGVVDDAKRRFSLEAPASMARSLAMLFHGGPVRFHGTGTWYRHSDGRWELRRFSIDRHEQLDDGPLAQVVAAARALGPTGWSELADPYAELARERGTEETPH